MNIGMVPARLRVRCRTRWVTDRNGSAIRTHKNEKPRCELDGSVVLTGTDAKQRQIIPRSGERGDFVS